MAVLKLGTQAPCVWLPSVFNMNLPPSGPKWLLNLQPHVHFPTSRKKKGKASLPLFKGPFQKSHLPLHLPYPLTFLWPGLSQLATTGKGVWQMQFLFHTVICLAKDQRIDMKISRSECERKELDPLRFTSCLV